MTQFRSFGYHVGQHPPLESFVHGEEALRSNNSHDLDHKLMI